MTPILIEVFLDALLPEEKDGDGDGDALTGESTILIVLVGGW